LEASATTLRLLFKADGTSAPGLVVVHVIDYRHAPLLSIADAFVKAMRILLERINI